MKLSEFIELLGAVGVATTGIASLINAIKKNLETNAENVSKGS